MERFTISRVPQSAERNKPGDFAGRQVLGENAIK
jgi:hypothetical protein